MDGQTYKLEFFNEIFSRTYKKHGAFKNIFQGLTEQRTWAFYIYFFRTAKTCTFIDFFPEPKNLHFLRIFS